MISNNKNPSTQPARNVMNGVSSLVVSPANTCCVSPGMMDPPSLYTESFASLMSFNLPPLQAETFQPSPREEVRH